MTTEVTLTPADLAALRRVVETGLAVIVARDAAEPDYDPMTAPDEAVDAAMDAERRYVRLCHDHDAALLALPATVLRWLGTEEGVREMDEAEDEDNEPTWSIVSERDFRSWRSSDWGLGLRCVVRCEESSDQLGRRVTAVKGDDVILTVETWRDQWGLWVWGRNPVEWEVAQEDGTPSFLAALIEALTWLREDDHDILSIVVLANDLPDDGKEATALRSIRAALATVGVTGGGGVIGKRDREAHVPPDAPLVQMARPNVCLDPDQARAVAALIAAGEWMAGVTLCVVGDLRRGGPTDVRALDRADDRLRAALADPSLTALRRTLAGAGEGDDDDA